MSIGNHEIIIHFEMCEECGKRNDEIYATLNEAEKNKLSEEIIECFNNSIC